MPAILVVDDSAADRQLVGGLLESRGNYLVTYAADGREALESVRRSAPDLVLTDLQMPDMSGLELVSNLKDHCPLIPVVLMTATGSEKFAVRALDEGAASYVRKVSLSRSLVQTVERVLDAAKEDLVYADVMDQMTSNELVFDLESDVTLLQPLTRHLQQLTRGAGVCSVHDVPRIGVALEEALLNAYYHGNLELCSEMRESSNNRFYALAAQRSCAPPYCARRIRVQAKLTRSQARFTIADEGRGFDVSALHDARDPAFIERPWGRGVLLMRAFMDDVIYNDSGNAVTLVKYAPGSDKRDRAASHGD